MPAVDYERTIRDYFDACTAGDARAIASFFAARRGARLPGWRHVPGRLPATRVSRSPRRSGTGFGDRFGGEFRTRWTVDHVIVDAERREAVIEWSNFKPSVSAKRSSARRRVLPLRRRRQDPRDPGLLRMPSRRVRPVRTSSASSTTRGAGTRWAMTAPLSGGQPRSCGGTEPKDPRAPVQELSGVRR